MEIARRPRTPGESVKKREARVEEIYETFARIQLKPNSITDFAWGHPHRRWSSFLATSALDELLRSRARVYLAHGARDSVVPVAAFELVRAELIRHGRDVTAQRFEDADHSLGTEGGAQTTKIRATLTHIASWFRS